MNPYFKAVRSVIRLAAAGLLIVGTLLAGVEFLNHRTNRVELNLLKVAGYGLMLIAGVILLAISSRLAASLTDEGDDDPDSPEDGAE